MSLMAKGLQGSTALMIGGSYSALPIVRALTREGINIILVTGDTSEPCARYSQQLVKVDYSDIVASEELLSDLEFDYVIPSCNDSSYTLAAKLARDRQLPGYDTEASVSIINSKSKFREFCNVNSIPSPLKLQEPFDIGDNSFPVVVKPNLSFSGRGISIVTSESKMKFAIDHARASSKDGNYTIEQYIDGTLHSISAYICGKSVSNVFFVDEFCRTYPYQVDTSNHPSILNQTIKSSVVSQLEKMSKLLNLVDGLVHIQFIVTNDKFFFIESMRRCPGDLYGHLIMYSTGFNYYRAYIEGFLGIEFENKGTLYPDLIPTARYTESSLDERVFESFTFETEVYKFFPLVKPGDKIDPAPYGKSSIGFFQFSSDDLLFEVLTNNSRLVLLKDLEED
jgi:biotin carboxylase